MRWLILSVSLALAVAALAAPSAASAQATSPDDPVTQVITDQLSAFQADDFETAFTYASPAIRGLFGSAERFGQMVRDGYPMVYRPAEVTMLDQTEVAGRTVQRVLIRDAAGRVHLLAYTMLRTTDGWQIDGVQILRAPQVGV